MKVEKRKQAEYFYIILSGVFIASLVSCNLIFQKFFYWNTFFFDFEISVGILPYPITFLVTDIISEIYGKKRANKVVFSGIVSSFFIFLVILLASKVPATSWSPVGDDMFNKVFGLTGVAVGASMSAYLLAQYIDIRVFHFFKKMTNGKHLWLRNNFSTITSQLIDTSVVVLLLCSTGVIPWDKFGYLILNGFLFKFLVAIVDTPFFYIFVMASRKYFNLKEEEELDF